MRLNKILTAFLLTAAFALTASAQPKSAKEDVRAVLLKFAELSKKEQLRTDAAREILTDELANPRADSFDKLSDAPDEILLIDKTHAVGRFQVSGERAIDVYFYLKTDGADWKIYALRAFAVPGFVEQLYDLWKADPNLSADDKQKFENLKLTLSADADLRAWFAANRQALDKLRGLTKNKSAASSLLTKLNLSSISTKENGSVEILIGGVTDNSVGFIYSPAGKPPLITTYEYIWVENLAENWYLFRTT